MKMSNDLPEKSALAAVCHKCKLVYAIDIQTFEPRKCKKCDEFLVKHSLSSTELRAMGKAGYKVG